MWVIFNSLYVDCIDHSMYVCMDTKVEDLPILWIWNLHHLIRWNWKMTIYVKHLVNLLMCIFMK